MTKTESSMERAMIQITLGHQKKEHRRNITRVVDREDNGDEQGTKKGIQRE